MRIWQLAHHAADLLCSGNLLASYHQHEQDYFMDFTNANAGTDTSSKHDPSETTGAKLQLL